MSEKHRKEIESLLNKSESGVNKRLQKLYKELAEETTQDIIKLAKEIEETDKFSKKLQKERLEAIRSQMYAKANQLEGTQKENIYDFLRHDGHVAFNELFYDFEMTEKIPLSFTMLTDKQINVIINTPVANRKLSTRLKGNSTKMKQNLNRVLTRGFAKGLSTQKMAVQIAEIGGANYRRAMNIARTESGRVTSVARQQSQNHAKEIGLKLEKQWISTLDKLTRSTHQILDGKRVGIDAYFEVSGHKALQPHMFGVASEDCNCRCRTITIVNGMGPELRKKNESKEVGEYKNYAEWLADRPEPKEEHYYAGVLGKTNMSSVFGESKYKDFLKQVESIPDERFKKILAKMEDKIEFNKTDKESFVDGSKVFLDEEAFAGSKNKKTMQVVIHELGHAIDNFGVNSLDTDFDRVSQIPQYRLKALIQKDLLNTFNNDLKLINGDAYEKVKSLKKMSIFDESAIVRKYKRLSEENPTTYSSLSDIMESTGVFVEYPLGHGHGLKYWKTYGNQEAEFFAHMTETLVNEDARKMMYEIFPEASKKWNSMIDDILKELD